MPEEAASSAEATQEQEVQEQPPARQEPPEDNLVGEARRKQRDAERQAKEARDAQKKLEQRLAELEDRDKSEIERHRGQLEREQKERERLQRELQQREERLTQLERGSWVRSAAVEAKFIDPEDAVLHANLAEIESERDAKNAVKKLAERKSHLIQSEQQRPEIGRVLQAGQPVKPGEPDPADEENQKFLDELKAASRRGWSSSGAGLLG